eukprot:PhF_6_TR32955/c0_g1_i1/m.48493
MERQATHKTHPCYLQLGKCNHGGVRCPYRQLPSKLCMNVIRYGNCDEPGCTWEHYDSNILDRHVETHNDAADGCTFDEILSLRILNYLLNRPLGCDTIYRTAVELEVTTDKIINEVSKHLGILQLDGDVIRWSHRRTASSPTQFPSVDAVYEYALTCATNWNESYLILRNMSQSIRLSVSLRRRVVHFFVNCPHRIHCLEEFLTTRQKFKIESFAVTHEDWVQMMEVKPGDAASLPSERWHFVATIVKNVTELPGRIPSQIITEYIKAGIQGGKGAHALRVILAIPEDRIILNDSAMAALIELLCKLSKRKEAWVLIRKGSRGPLTTISALLHLCVQREDVVQIAQGTPKVMRMDVFECVVKAFLRCECYGMAADLVLLWEDRCGSKERVDVLSALGKEVLRAIRSMDSTGKESSTRLLDGKVRELEKYLHLHS